MLSNFSNKILSSSLERFLKFFTDERIAKKVFSGTIEDFLKLTTLEQDKIIEMYKEKKIEQEYNNFKIETSYAGTLEDYLKLSYAEKDAIIDKHKEEERNRKNAEDSFNIIKKRTISEISNRYFYSNTFILLKTFITT